MDEATLAHQALNQPTSELFEKLPAEVQEYVAQWIIKDHPMVDYIKRSADLCTSTLQAILVLLDQPVLILIAPHS